MTEAIATLPADYAGHDITMSRPYSQRSKRAILTPEEVVEMNIQTDLIEASQLLDNYEDDLNDLINELAIKVREELETKYSKLITKRLILKMGMVLRRIYSMEMKAQRHKI